MANEMVVAGKQEKRKALKNQIELLIGEISVTQQKIQKLQLTVENLQTLMTQEYANFHNALHEEKQRMELLASRVDNQENLYRAEIAKLEVNVKASEQRQNYKMNSLLQDIKDDIGKLQISVTSFGKRKHVEHFDATDVEHSCKPLFARSTIGIFQFCADFLICPIENVLHLAEVVFMIFVIYHVCGFIMCNILCSTFQQFNIFTAIDGYRARTVAAAAQGKV